jgi:hypothetical protein
MTSIDLNRKLLKQVRGNNSNYNLIGDFGLWNIEVTKISTIPQLYCSGQFYW